MQIENRAGLGLLVLMAAACMGEPDIDFEMDVSPEADAGNTGNAESGVRVLSDAMPPNARDASRADLATGGGSTGAAGAGGNTGNAGAAGKAGADSGDLDAATDAGSRDVALDRGAFDVVPTDSGRAKDAATDTRDASAEPGGDARRIDVVIPTADVTVDALSVDAPRIDAVDEGDGAGPSDLDAADADTTDAPTPPAPHLLITEVVIRPGGAEMIEIYNPTETAVGLQDYLVSDSHLYYEIAVGTFATASGSDFVARFPDGAQLEPHRYAVVALGNAAGGSQSYAATYGKMPDFELRPAANQATDDPSVANMVAVGASIGASASLTDGGELVVLFSYRDGDLVTDVDYLFYGAATASNPMVDKTGIVVGGSAYRADTPAAAQHTVAAPAEGGSIHRCVYAEAHETSSAGNGMGGHDETSEDSATAFSVSTTATERTPGEPPPLNLCRP